MIPYNPLQKFGISLVTSAFSTRQDGNMSFSYGNTRNCLENRKKFLSSIGIDYRSLICAKQVHGRSVEFVTEIHKGKGAINFESSFPDTDGFITDRKGVPISILTADCLSIFIYDPKKPAVGIIHAGWRGTEQNITQEVIRSMQINFGSQPHRLLVGFGPCIRSCCLEMEKNFKSNFPYGLSEKEGKLFMDIALVNKRQLVDSGVLEKNIFDPQICTATENNNYFSFRKEADAAGRLISVIMLK